MYTKWSITTHTHTHAHTRTHAHTHTIAHTLTLADTLVRTHTSTLSVNRVDYNNLSFISFNFIRIYYSIHEIFGSQRLCFVHEYTRVCYILCTCVRVCVCV